MTHTLTLTIPDALWMSSNQRLNRFDHANRTRGVRALARDTALMANLARMTQAHIGIFVGYSTRVKADPPNAWPTAKAAIDGIVTDAGLLADDSSEFVYCHSFMRDPKRTERGTHTLRLVFTDEELPWMTPEKPTGCPRVPRSEHSGCGMSGGTNMAEEANTSRRSVRKGKGA